MRLYHLVRVVAFGLLALSFWPVPAAASAWFDTTTAEGCTISWLVNDDFYSPATFARDIHFSWSGTCERGQPASGRGRLSEDIVAGNAGGTPPQHWDFEGNMVNGVFDGDAKVDFYQEGQLVWSKTFPHNMGCSTDSCVPRPRTAVTSQSARPIMEEPWNGAGKPPTAPEPTKKAGATSRSKDKPAPHLSDDQKILNEMLHQQRVEHDDFRSKRLAHIKSEAERLDAVTVTVENVNGHLAFRLINNTDIILSYQITYTLKVDGEPAIPPPVGFMLSPFQNYLDEVISVDSTPESANPMNWNVTDVHVKWAAHPWNYEGTWNTDPQGDP